ncbi:MAG: hypothetical protein JKX70_06545 [Phycisphaerales bacterium]|nr:hypothetical protein [Phycisphaerales bacterium]
MAYDGQDRRGKSSERRKSSTSKPPPGTVIDRRLGLDQRTENDPRNGSAKGSSSTNKTASTKSRKKSLLPNADSPAKPTPTDDGFTGLERKRGRGRRLSEFTKSAEEGEMTTEQFLFLMAIDAFKKGNDRMFPTWTDVLEVIRLLGYRKTMPTELNLTNAEDWLERSDTPANVRPDRWAERFTSAEMSDESAISAPKNAGPKSEAELTDEAIDAFEAAFGSDEDLADAEEFIGEEFDSDTDFDGFSEAA